METLRGGFLLLFRWLVHYPFVHVTYRVRNWTRAPFLMQTELQDHSKARPGILVSNYGNYFYDDILGLMLGPVWPFVFVRDSLYRIFFLRPIFKFFRSIPYVRASDTRFSTEERHARNEKTYARVAGLLKQGHWFSVFPESIPGHRPKILKPLRPGAAHIALRAEALADWKLGLNIYVYGTNYENKFAGRSNVFIRWAQPIAVAKYKEVYGRDAAEAEAGLMLEIEKTLQSVVIEAPSLEALADAYRLSYQQRQPTIAGVQNALKEVVAGTSTPEQMRQIVCRKGRESLVFQFFGLIMIGVSWAIGWPFRMFGRLCASDRSEEMTFQFLLWLLVLVTGAFVNESHWAKAQFIATWLAMDVWLWAWRRGVVDERM